VQPKPPNQNHDRLEQLLREAQAGSREALGQLLQGCRGILHHSASRQLPDDLQAKGDASDLVQETLLDAHQGFEQFRGRTVADLFGWLFQILRTNCLGFVRAFRGRGKREIAREVPLPEQKNGELPLPADESSPSSNVARREGAEALREALGQLPPHYREVIQLHHYEGLPFAEVGRRMGYSEEAIRKIWSRALERLAHHCPGGGDF
jgi:RNA polymerase sigma-70 factor (ECF subfamily)